MELRICGTWEGIGRSYECHNITRILCLNNVLPNVFMVSLEEVKDCISQMFEPAVCFALQASLPIDPLYVVGTVMTVVLEMESYIVTFGVVCYEEFSLSHSRPSPSVSTNSFP